MRLNLTKKEWFENWFHEKYDQLYPHRSCEQAELQVRSLLAQLSLKKNKPWLDLGCGAGRHLKVLSEMHSTIGMDLSSWLLKQIPSSLAKCRGDLRSLPFADKSVEAVFSFFTSFGYFETPKEDLRVLQEYSRVLTEGGILYLDLMNPLPLLKGLPNDDFRLLDDGSEVTQTRYFHEGKVCKDIVWMNSTGEIEEYHERVRLYDMEKISDLAKNCSLKPMRILGSEKGEPFDLESSLRMSFIFEKVCS